MRFYSIPAYIYSSLTIRISRRPTVIDKCRFQVRLFARPYMLRMFPHNTVCRACRGYRDRAASQRSA